MTKRNLIVGLNRLWKPVRPYLARQVGELFGRHDGSVLEIGPFSGLAFELADRGMGTTFRMTVFPDEVVEPLEEEARELGMEELVTVTVGDEGLCGIAADAFDLIVFRGAFFFPSFFVPDLQAIYRSLSQGGVALLGGGFGCHTPEDVIKGIEKRSKDLNQALGRVRIDEKDLWSILERAGLAEKAHIITEGGLWAVVKKT
jgi:hypothetical protein